MLNTPSVVVLSISILLSMLRLAPAKLLKMAPDVISMLAAFACERSILPLLLMVVLSSVNEMPLVAWAVQVLVVVLPSVSEPAPFMVAALDIQSRPPVLMVAVPGTLRVPVVNLSLPDITVPFDKVCVPPSKYGPVPENAMAPVCVPPLVRLMMPV